MTSAMSYVTFPKMEESERTTNMQKTQAINREEVTTTVTRKHSALYRLTRITYDKGNTQTTIKTTVDGENQEINETTA